MIYEYLLAAWTWVMHHPLTSIAVAVWLIANFAPRPHPEQSTGWRKTFWQIVDRLCVLTADALPGRLKMPLIDSPAKKAPDPPSAAPADDDLPACKPKVDKQGKDDPTGAAESDSGVSVEVDTDETNEVDSKS